MIGLRPARLLEGRVEVRLPGDAGGGGVRAGVSRAAPESSSESATARDHAAGLHVRVEQRRKSRAGSRRTRGATAPRPRSGGRATRGPRRRRRPGSAPRPRGRRPDRSTAWWWKLFTATASSPEDRAQARAGSSSTSWARPARGPVGVVLDRALDDLDGMSWTSVPPAATFSTCWPRQIARIGRSRRRASADERDLEGVAPPDDPPRGRVGRLAERAGSTSAPPDSSRPSHAVEERRARRPAAPGAARSGRRRPARPSARSPAQRVHARLVAVADREADDRAASHALRDRDAEQVEQDLHLADEGVDDERRGRRAGPRSRRAAASTSASGSRSGRPARRRRRAWRRWRPPRPRPPARRSPRCAP